MLWGIFDHLFQDVNLVPHNTFQTVLPIFPSVLKYIKTYYRKNQNISK